MLLFGMKKRCLSENAKAPVKGETTSLMELQQQPGLDLSFTAAHIKHTFPKFFFFANLFQVGGTGRATCCLPNPIGDSTNLAGHPRSIVTLVGLY